MFDNESEPKTKTPSVRMYVDENGNYNLREDLSNNNNRFLCLTGVIMSLSEHDILDKHLNDMKLRYIGSTDVILHRREIISAKPPFKALKDEIARDGFNTILLRIITELKYEVISILIDKKALVDKYTLLKAYDPYALALEFLMQRFQYRMQQYSKDYGQIYGDIIAESRGGREDRITKETYTLMYDGKGYNELVSADMFYSLREIKLKKKKDNIAGLQLVDLISHPSRRYILTQNNLAHDIKPTSFEQKVVEELVKSKFYRQNGIIEGYGTVFFPK